MRTHARTRAPRARTCTHTQEFCRCSRSVFLLRGTDTQRFTRSRPHTCCTGYVCVYVHTYAHSVGIICVEIVVRWHKCMQVSLQVTQAESKSTLSLSLSLSVCLSVCLCAYAHMHVHSCVFCLWLCLVFVLARVCFDMHINE